MSTESGGNRWWENYLVRYLMPSIAGMAIVSWLCSHGGVGLRAILLLPPVGVKLDPTSLTLLFLYGNLFCYIASYPVLVFHVTRVMDYSDGKWPATYLFDGYIVAIAFAMAAFVFFHLSSAECHFWGAFLLVAIIVAVQLARLYKVISPRIPVDGLLGTVSLAFGYTYALAKRRGVLRETETKISSANAPVSTINSTDDDYRNDDVKASRELAWHQDFIATYRHMREHGNSAFIFLFELILAALVYFVIKKSGQSPEQQLGAIGTLFALWAVPAVFVHLLGQHLERRFSHFDRRANNS